MKKYFYRLVISITTFSIISFNIPIPILAKLPENDGNSSHPVQMAISEITELENIEPNLISCESLNDINGDSTYFLLEFSKGYAIVSKENGIISEYDLSEGSNPYEQYSGQLYYGGPFNYFDEATYINEIRLLNSDDINLIGEINKEFLQIDNTGTMLLGKNEYVGISSSRMSNYSSGKWINSSSNYPSSQGYPSAGICGTIASAGLLAYYDDYVSDDYVPASLRTRYSSTPGSLITTLYNYIDKGKSGTIASNLGSGINSYLRAYSSSNYKTSYGLATTWAAAVSKINSSRPIVIGLASILGSTYGDHWVLVYQYYAGANGTDYYRCVDNHGSYNKVIQVAWSVGYAMLQ